MLTSSGGTAIHRTEKQPLYLQHHGHSRTIVGIEIGKRRKVEDDDDDKDGGGASVNGNGRGRGKTVKSKIRRMASKGKHGDGEGGGEEEVWLLLFDPGKCVDRSWFFPLFVPMPASWTQRQGTTAFPPEGSISN